jgi:hypothetical protein
LESRNAQPTEAEKQNYHLFVKRLAVQNKDFALDSYSILRGELQQAACQLREMLILVADILGNREYYGATVHKINQTVIPLVRHTETTFAALQALRGQAMHCLGRQPSPPTPLDQLFPPANPPKPAPAAGPASDGEPTYTLAEIKKVYCIHAKQVLQSGRKMSDEQLVHFTSITTFRADALIEALKQWKEGKLVKE